MTDQRRRRFFAVLAVAALLPVLTSACGGRVARPVKVTSPLDAQLTCAHIRAENDVNIARIQDLSGERGNAAANNVGAALFIPLFIDLSDSERQEMKALSDRNDVLRQLAQEKDCPPAG